MLLHAGICDSRMWAPQWERYAKTLRVLRYDRRGFGRSPIGAGTFSNGRDLVELIERERFERAALVGVSMGGRVALEVAIARPDLVTTLVLVGAGLPGHDWSEEMQAANAEEEAALEAGDIDAAVEVMLRTWVDGPRRPPEDVDPEVRARIADMQRRAYELQLPVWETADEEPLVPDVASRIGEVRAETMVLVGEEDVPDIQEMAARLASDIPNARRATIANAAHVPSMERPREFDELVLPFLREAAA